MIRGTDAPPHTIILDEVEPCEHEWEFRPDWEGNPDIPYGTRDCSTYYCPKCDLEQSEQPDDYEPPFTQEDLY